ncbi:MAG: hypothetical protein G8345_02780 [Magnetococcales bacterium]|nr:hypothetical protein [Magnetococcales bacterium]
MILHYSVLNTDPENDITPLLEKWVLFVSVVFFIIILSWRLLLPIFLYPNTTGNFDSYIYASRGVVLSCPPQSCPGMDSIRLQAGDPEANLDLIARTKTGIKTLGNDPASLKAHPIHPYLLFALHEAGLSWIDSYRWVSLGGGVLIIITCIILMVTVFGPLGGGIGLCLLALHLFVRQGYNLVIPSTLGIAFGMLAWWSLLKFGTNRILLTITFIALAVGNHPMGQVFGGIGWIMLFLMFNHEAGMRKWIILFLLGLLLVFPLVIPYLEESQFPQRLFSFQKREEWQGWAGIQLNLYTAFYVVYLSFSAFGGWVAGIILFIQGLFSLNHLPQPIRSRLWGLLVALTIMLFISLFYVYPAVSADLFVRVWVGAGTLVCGIIGYGFARWLMASRKIFQHLRDKNFSFNSHPSKLLVHSFLGLLFCYGFISHQRTGWWNHHSEYIKTISIMDQAVDPNQIKRLLELAPDRVLYQVESLWMYFMLQDTWRIPAVGAWLINNDEKQIGRYLGNNSPPYWLPGILHSKLWESENQDIFVGVVFGLSKENP